MRKPIIAGNWKMNRTPAQALTLLAEIAPLVADATCDVVVCPPFVALSAAAQALKGTNIALGAQNLHFAPCGAYTGEVSAQMLCELGVRYVIIGHSERRQYFAETDQTVNQKALFALENSLIPIICVGESLTQREQGVTAQVLTTQTRAALAGMTAEQVAGIVIAYEPIWAIGTGRTATAAQADEGNAIIRACVGELFGAAAADAIRIQYGGSMNAANAAELMAQPNIDGGLIGGASLKAADFAAIVHA